MKILNIVFELEGHIFSQLGCCGTNMIYLYPTAAYSQLFGSCTHCFTGTMMIIVDRSYSCIVQTIKFYLFILFIYLLEPGHIQPSTYTNVTTPW